MIIKKLIEKIEGDAELDFTFNKGQIEDVKISFAFYRGIEEILSGKDPRDALVITPRVCGICNHAHLLTAVHTLEDGYKNAGLAIELSSKAKKIREFTLACELIQNHSKWFYLTILPQLENLLQEQSGENHPLKASYFSSTITKALAIFGGQWPHSSYAVPGGVTCDPTYVDVMQAENLLDDTIRFYEQIVIGLPLEKYLSMETASSLHELQGDFGRCMQLIGMNNMAREGQSHDHFIVFGQDLFFHSGKAIRTVIANVNMRYVKETIQEGSTSKGVMYKGRVYEAGPLARAMVNKEPIIRNLHKLYKDSMLTRIFARMHEVALLMQYSKTLLKELRLEEPSCTLEKGELPGDFEGSGAVEAARGSLIHHTTVKNGKIDKYDIIVPTQWNLSHGTEKEEGVAIKAMIGSETTEEASFIFRTFDVCSVCTTQ